MDLLLWRHAQAHELAPGLTDMDRPLTPRGRQQAQRMARWLQRHLPADTRILCSPALRTRQTVQALSERQHHIVPSLAPDASVRALLQAADWPHARQPVLIVGHQPTLGLLVAKLLGLPAGQACPIKKGALWWLRQRQRDGHWQTILRTVQSPELL